MNDRAAYANADARLLPLPNKSVHMIATSPPYWGLRSYATGDNKHAELGAEKVHDCGAWARRTIIGYRAAPEFEEDGDGNMMIVGSLPEPIYGPPEKPCGACYVCNMRTWAAEMWRVLRDDGVMFLNLGDSYAAQGGGCWPAPTNTGNKAAGGSHRVNNRPLPGLKPKDLVGIPWRVALALQADGWYLRSDVIWAKPNPMPESVTDRPTKAHEYVFLLTKSPRYFWDSTAVRENVDAEAITEYNIWHGNQGLHYVSEDATARTLLAGEVRQVGPGGGLQGLSLAVREGAPQDRGRASGGAKGQQEVQGERTRQEEPRRISANGQDETGPRELEEVSGGASLSSRVSGIRQEEGGTEKTLREWKGSPIDRPLSKNGQGARELVAGSSQAPGEDGRDCFDVDGDGMERNQDCAGESMRDLRQGNETPNAGSHSSIEQGGASRQGEYSSSLSELQQPEGKQIASGRNLRTVWTIATAPYSGAHYATWPAALVETMVKAGTSERGVCPTCGAPWRRVVEKSEPVNAPRNPNDVQPYPAASGYNNGNGATTLHKVRRVETVEWRPTCGHDAAPIPAVVLDPFAGSGTTLLVARQLGRVGLGFDLSETYLRDNAAVRLGHDKLAAWGRGIVDTGDYADLFRAHANGNGARSDDHEQDD